MAWADKWATPPAPAANPATAAGSWASRWAAPTPPAAPATKSWADRWGGSTAVAPTYQAPWAKAAGDFALATASTIGSVLQPLQAPQQLVLGAVAEAQGNRGALGRGAAAAAGYLTYGAAEGLPGLAAARTRAVRGAEIAKAMGADDTTAKWTGLGIDILGDPATLVGGVGLLAKGGAAAAKVGRLGGLAAKLDTAGAAILRTSAQVERSTNAFRGVAQGITQGVGLATVARAGRLGDVLADARQTGTITGALAEIRPAFREAALQTTWENVLGKELDVSKVPFFTATTGAKRASVAELLVPQEILRRIAPVAEVKKLEFARELRLQGNLLQNEFKTRAETSLNAFKAATTGLGRKEIDEFDGILSRIMDAPDRASNRLARDELAALGQRVGKPELEQQGLAALAAGIRLDVWGGQQLARVGVFSKEGLLENLAFESGTRRTVGGGSGEVPSRLNPEANPRRGLRRLYGLFEDPEAHIQKVLAMNRSASVSVDASKLGDEIATALSTFKSPGANGANGYSAAGAFQVAADQRFIAAADPDAIGKLAANFIGANPNASIGELLAEVATKTQLDGVRLKLLLDTVSPKTLQSVADLPGVIRSKSSAEVAELLRNRLLEPSGAGGTGAMAVGTGNFTARKNLSAEIRDDYGQLDSFRAQIVDQVNTAARGVVNKNALLETRAFLEAEGLIYSRLPQRIADGTADVSKLPSAVLNRPTVVAGVQKPGWRTLSNEETSGLGGVFQAGDVVPDWVQRTVTVGNKAGSDMPAVFDWAVRNWKATKLGNPSTIAVNVMSGIVQAEQYGIGPVDLARGFMQYLNRGTKGQKELLNAGIGMDTQLSTEFTREAAQIIARMGGADKAKNPIEYIGRVIDEVTGARIGALGDDPLAKVLKYSPGRNLLQVQQMSETALKGSIYYAARNRGADAASAGHLAAESMFDYAARPLMTTFLSRTGIQPFATFSTFSAWRTLQNLYERPFRTARLYRIPDALKEDSEKIDKELAVARDFIKEKLPVRIFEDSEGRGWYVPLQALLPEGAVTDLIDDTNAQNLFGKIPVPPAFALVQALSTGVGFQGQNIYQGLGQRGGGANSVDAFKNNPIEAGRRVLKQLWQFGVSPWMPGQPQTERLARAIAQTALRDDQIELANDIAPGTFGNAVLRFMEDGPISGYGEGLDSVNSIARNGEGATPLPLAAARFAGIRAYQVQGDANKPGAAQSALQATEYQIQDRLTYWRGRIKSANPSDRARLTQEAQADLKLLGQQIQQKRQQLTGGR